MDFDLLLFFPFLLYAETHYHFRKFFSYLKKHEPELIADAPHRIEPANSVPLLVLSKDAHRYPCTLRQVAVDVKQDLDSILTCKLLDSPILLSEKWWWKIFWLDVPNSIGWIELDVSISIESKGKIKTYHNDNHKTSSHKPLRVFVANEPLPRFEGLHFGDCHTHSTYTDDQVEFGSPLAASIELSKAMGLSFFCVTDHSYDLDDSVDNYLRNDPNFPKWKLLNAEIDQLNKSHADFTLVRGEEVTCRNSADRNVHLLLLGTRNFFAGSGDSAEQWFRTTSEHSVAEILTKKDANSLAFAAHPKEPVPLLQRLLIGRGEWSDVDLLHENLNGLEFANGEFGEGFVNGHKSWIKALLRGKKIFTIAGNDAHGNFNRFRQIGIPFFRIKELNRQLFGRMRTGVFLDKAISEDAILQALKAGRSIICDGPVVNLKVKNHRHGALISTIGETLRGKEFQLVIIGLSSAEFGEIQTIKAYIGIVGDQSEKLLQHWEDRLGFSFEQTIDAKVDRPCYIRVELLTSLRDGSMPTSHFAFSNPIWLNPSV